MCGGGGGGGVGDGGGGVASGTRHCRGTAFFSFRFFYNRNKPSLSLAFDSFFLKSNLKREREGGTKKVGEPIRI